jgi:hypothetical protein
MMRRRAVDPGRASESARNLLTAAAVMAAGVLICIDQAPKPLDTTDGLSWFGVNRETVVVYGLTMVVTSLLLVRVAAMLSAVPELRPLRLGLLGCATLMPLMVATPYTVDAVFNWTHMTIGAVLFVLQILVAVWLWWVRARTAAVGALLTVQVLGGVVCFSSLVDLNDAMLYGQLVFQVAFTACIAIGIAAAVSGRERVSGSGSPATSSCSN